MPGPNPDELLDYTVMNPSMFGAAGELISSARDLDRFFVALLQGRLVPTHLLAEMLAPGVAGSPYGLGRSCGTPPAGVGSTATTETPWPTSPGPT